MRDTRHINARAALVRHALADQQQPLPKKFRVPTPPLQKVEREDGYVYYASRAVVRSVGMRRMINLLLTPEKGAKAA
jgi:hypothetical protein